MIQIDKLTGRVESYHNNRTDQEGKVTYTREQCWNRAEVFLQRVFPEYAEYLQLEVERTVMDAHEEELEETELNDREWFFLPLFIDQYRVKLERASIIVCKITGEVLLYRGVSMELIRELKACRFEVVISSEEALSRYVDQLEVDLKWFYDDRTRSYRLIFDPILTPKETKVAHETQRTLEYIDAKSGELIWCRT
ncbi:hypothetical protein JCM10914A_50050 [Paenibacillus sp. JCM 10914]